MALAACERLVGLDDAKVAADADASIVDAARGETGLADGPTSFDCEQVAPRAVGQAQVPLMIPRLTNDLPLGFPADRAWCRSPRLPIDRFGLAGAPKGYFRALWSTDALWLLVAWDDDVWFTENFFSYNNDGFDIVIDPNGSRDDYIQPNDAFLGFEIGSRDVKGFEGSPPHSFLTADIKVETLGTTTTWLLRLPWSEMGASAAQLNQQIGLDVGIRDTDGAASTQSAWWHTTNGGEVKRPDLWGQAVLAP
ncbi:MAG: sugar-binding protein [Deltaproteobacteria bacterium]|nr:sugar-binding protein [Deltaproteobacteria bacterium]